MALSYVNKYIHCTIMNTCNIINNWIKSFFLLRYWMKSNSNIILWKLMFNEKAWIMQESGYDKIWVHKPYVLHSSNVFQLLIYFFLFILGWQNKISDSNLIMRLQPWVLNIKSILREN